MSSCGTPRPCDDPRPVPDVQLAVPVCPGLCVLPVAVRRPARAPVARSRNVLPARVPEHRRESSRPLQVAALGQRIGLIVNRRRLCMGRWVSRTAVMRMGCCTSLLYGVADARKNTVKAVLTSALLHSRLQRQLVPQAAGGHAPGVTVFVSSVLSWNSLCLRNAARPALSG
jgi:hypothetical protein